MKRVPVIMLLLFCAVSCRFVDSVMHDEEPIARVGDSYLFFSDIKDGVPEFLSPEDSAATVRQYINNWATSLLYRDLAEKQLAEDERNVDEELGDYYRSLLRYRYEQRYVNERLDTVVTEAQIRDYYKKNTKEFILERPVLKVRFVDLPGNYQEKDKFIREMANADGDDVVRLEGEVRAVALKYFDSSDKWMDAAVLAREFGTDWYTMMHNRTGDIIKMYYDLAGDTRIAFICDEVLSGPAPIEYCFDLIRDIVLSVRKHRMLNDLENNVIDDAMRREYFEIYGK